VSHDLVIRGGRVVDGTGAPAFAADVAITDGRVIEIGEVTGDAERTIDADGLVVAPGFIDAHTHYDAQLLWDPTANPSTAHGITTVLLGNCGYTLAPVRADDQDYLMGLFAAAEEIPKAALQQFAPLAWESFPEYLDWMDGRVGVNVVRDGGGGARTGGDRRRGRPDGPSGRGGDGRRRRRDQQQPGPAPAGRGGRAHPVVLR
jgi:N-acyl-D-amino-acid deacylase